MAQCYCHQKVPRTGQGMALHAGFHPVIMDVDGAPSNLPSSMRHAVENRETSPAKSARPEIKNLHGATCSCQSPLTEEGGSGASAVTSGREIPSRPRDKGSLRPAAPLLRCMAPAMCDDHPPRRVPSPRVVPIQYHVPRGGLQPIAVFCLVGIRRRY